MRDIRIFLQAVGILFSIGAIVACIFYYIKKRDLFGGLIGGVVVGLIGAIIGAYVLDYFFYEITVNVLTFLSQSAGINIIAGFIGAYCALFIMNKLNHDRIRDKVRKKY